MAVQTRAHEHATAQVAPPPKGKWRRRLTTGGWFRALWVTPLSFGLATLLAQLLVRHPSEPRESG